MISKWEGGREGGREGRGGEGRGGEGRGGEGRGGEGRGGEGRGGEELHCWLVGCNGKLGRYYFQLHSFVSILIFTLILVASGKYHENDIKQA